MTLFDAMKIATEGLETWRAKPHNAKWWRRIDGTPIPNDLPIVIAEAFVNAIAPCDAEIAIGEEADMELSVQAGEKSTDAKLAILRHSIGEGADKLFEAIGWHYQASSPEDTRQGISLIQNAFAARDTEIATLRAALDKALKFIDCEACDCVAACELDEEAKPVDELDCVYKRAAELARDVRAAIKQAEGDTP